jgi:hypothetical protein
VLSTAGHSTCATCGIRGPLSANCEEDISIHFGDALASLAAAGSRLSRSWGRSPLSPRTKPGPPSPGFPLLRGFDTTRGRGPLGRLDQGGAEGKAALKLCHVRLELPLLAAETLLELDELPLAPLELVEA